MTDHIEIKAVFDVSDAGKITGTAWPFGSEDRVGDIVVKGAFGTPATLPMLWAHDQAQVVGVWTEITETDAGLTVKGQLLVDDVERAREVRAMIRAGAATGLSIGFVTKAATPRKRGRTITALDLHEISVVAVPCHRGAQITSIKSQEETPMEQEEIIEDTAPVIPANDAPGIDTKAFEKIVARLDKIEAKGNRPAPAIIGTAKPGTIEAKAFESFLRRGVERISGDEVKALTVANDATGGYLAPETFGDELIKLLNEYSPIRQYARVVTISGPEIVYPRRVSGTTATWVSEVGDRTESGMVFEQVRMTPHELATFTDVSNALLEDNAYGLEGELLTDFAETFAKTEGVAFINGTGVGQPKGIMIPTNPIAEMKTGVAASFPTTNPADVIIAMFHKIATTYAQAGVWMMNRNTLATVRQWKDGNGRYLVLDPITNGAPSTLLGRPVVEMPDMDDIGAGKFPILFGDASGYRIIDRVGLSILRDPFTIAGKGQVRFHARKRVGADLTHPDRFVRLKVSA